MSCPRAFHLLLTLLLAAGLIPAGLPPLLFGTVAAVSPAPSPPSSCCCGTVDGGCCDEVCCGMAPSREQSQPRPTVPVRPIDHNPLSVFLAADPAEAPHQGRSPLADPSRLRDLPAAPTLQADRVRIQT